MTRTEWIGANHVFIAVTDAHEDQYGQTQDEGNDVLVLGDMDGNQELAIEGSLGDLETLALRILDAVQRAKSRKIREARKEES